MVNQAIEAMVTEKFGAADWEKVKQLAGVDDPAFLAMRQYPDSVTYALAGAVSRHASLPIAAVLHAFGVYWIEYARRGPWGKLMTSSGTSTYELLAALDAMHAVAADAPQRLDRKRFPGGVAPAFDRFGAELAHEVEEHLLRPLVPGNGMAVIAVVTPQARSQRLCLIADIIQNAATVFQAANLPLHIFGLTFKEQTGEDTGR
jgi:hypothetical protein